MKNIVFTKIIKNNWSLLFVIAFFIVTLICVIVLGDNIYLQVHDNLDSNIAQYKMLKDGNLFWSFGTNVPFLGGIDRNYLQSDLKLYSLLYMIFPCLAAIIIGWYLKIIIAILGFYLLGKSLYANKVDFNVFIICGLLYGILPTFPTTPFGFASIPLLLGLLIRFYRNNKKYYYLFFFLYPVLSEFSLFGIFIIAFLCLFFVLDWVYKRRPKWSFLLLIFVLAAGYVVTEWRLFFIMLLSGTPTIRETFIAHYLDSKNALKEAISVFIEGQYHSASSHTILVLPICVVYWIYINVKYIRKREFVNIVKDVFNWLMFFQIIICALYAIDHMQWFDHLIATVLPPLKGFSFARFLWFSPFLWYLMLMVFLCRVQWKKIINVIVTGAVFLSICLYPQTYNHIYYNMLNIGNRIKNEQFSNLSYGEFYSVQLFDEIKRKINYDGEWAVAFGMHPSILSYNQIATLDGYLSFYGKTYKETFRKLIEPELNVDSIHTQYFDEWGGRAYLFSNEISYEPDRTTIKESADLLIDVEVFREMGGKFVFSRVKINNYKDLGFIEVGKFSSFDSPYIIYVYEAS